MSLSPTGLLATRRLAGAPPRIAAIDTLRGVAILGMVVYHGAFDLTVLLPDLAPDVGTPAWLWFRSGVLSAFLALAGLGCALGLRRGLDLGGQLRRLGPVLAAAVLITLLSLAVTPQAPVLFGVLHFLVVATPLCLLLARLPALALALLVPLPWLVAGTGPEAFAAPALMWTGIGPGRPDALDYVPLCPWATALLAGFLLPRLPAMAAWLERSAHAAPAGWTCPLRWAGRNALAVYLLHQPLLFALLAALALVIP